MNRVSWLLCAVLVLGGCYRMTLRHGQRVPEAGAARERWVHTFFGGLWQLDGPVKLDSLCPQGVAVIEQEVSVANWAVTQLSSVPLSASGAAANPLAVPAGYAVVGRHLSVWDPVTVRVLCAKGALQARKLAVVRLQPRGGITADTAALFTDSLIAELRRQPGTTVLGDADISAAIGLERQKQLLGCSEDSSCLAEIGGALGVDRLIHGSIGRVGESLVINISSIDPDGARAVSSVSERLKASSDEAFLDALPGIAQQLMLEPIAPSGR